MITNTSALGQTPRKHLKKIYKRLARLANSWRRAKKPGSYIPEQGRNKIELLFLNKQYQQIIDAMSSYEDLTFSLSARELVVLGLSYYRLSDADKALEIFNKTVVLFPNNAECRYQLTYILMKQQLFHEAKIHLEILNTLEPLSKRSIKLGRDILWYLEDYDSSLELFKIYDGQNESKEQIKRRIDTHVMRQQYKEALIDATKLVELEPQDHFNHQRLSIVESCASKNIGLSAMPLQLWTANRNELLKHLREYGWGRINIADFYGATKGKELLQAASEQMSEIQNYAHVKALYSRITSDDSIIGDRGFKPDLITEKDCLNRVLNCYDPLARTYLQPEMVDFARAYLGYDPLPLNGSIWIRPAIASGRKRTGSQIWHRDQEDYNILKCFLYFTDVSDRSGALEYVPKSRPLNDEKYSRLWGFPMSTGYPGDFKMNQVAKEDITTASGSIGDLFFVDTSGFHRGGYTIGGERIVTQVTFLRKSTFYVQSKRGHHFNIHGIESLAQSVQESLRLD